MTLAQAGARVCVADIDLQAAQAQVDRIIPGRIQMLLRSGGCHRSKISAVQWLMR